MTKIGFVSKVSSHCGVPISIYCRHIPDIFNIFADLAVFYRHTFILGDFNADLNSQSYDAELIKPFVNSMHLSLVPYAPIHRTRASSTRLDLYIIDDLDKLIFYDQQNVSIFFWLMI